MRFATTLGELRDLLEECKGFAPSTPILVGGPDHSYREASVIMSDATFHPKYGWGEYHKDEDMVSGEVKRSALIID